MLDESPSIWFPSDIRTESSNNKIYPLIEFTVQGKDRMFKSIYLPMPKGVSFNDGGNYSTTNIGTLGGAEGAALDAASQAMMGNMSGARDTVKGIGRQQIINTAGSFIKDKIKAEMPKVDKAADLALFAIKKVNPPNTNTTFESNSIRSFSFAVTMLARNRQDSLAIRDIHRLFRRYTYAGTDKATPTVLMDYPPIWRIRFLIDGKENQYMPKIFACYLKSITTTFNQDGNIFYFDSANKILNGAAPFDVSINMQFEETRVLSRKDIDNLDMISDTSSDEYRGIDSQSGLPKSGIAYR